MQNKPGPIKGAEFLGPDGLTRLFGGLQSGCPFILRVRLVNNRQKARAILYHSAFQVIWHGIVMIHQVAHRLNIPQLGQKLLFPTFCAEHRGDEFPELAQDFLPVFKGGGI